MFIVAHRAAERTVQKCVTGLFRTAVDFKKNEHEVFIDVMSVQDMEIHIDRILEEAVLINQGT